MADNQLALLGEDRPLGLRTCSAGLRKLLTAGDDSSGACRLVAINPTLRAEVERQYPALLAAMEPAHDVDLMRVLVQQAQLLGIGQRGEDEWADLMGIYLTQLKDFPLEAIEEAFAKWNRGELYPKDVGRHAFFPKPAELHALGTLHLTDMRIAAYRARKALEHVEKAGVEWTPERKAAERQKMIDQGLLTADGKPNFQIKAKSIPDDRPRLSPHQMAEQLRASDAAARYSGAPISRHHITPAPVDDIGDVI